MYMVEKGATRRWYKVKPANQIRPQLRVLQNLLVHDASRKCHECMESCLKGIVAPSNSAPSAGSAIQRQPQTTELSLLLPHITIEQAYIEPFPRD